MEFPVVSTSCEITEIAQRLRHGELTSASMTAAYLEAIATYDRELGAFLFVDGTRALAVAGALDAVRAAGTDLGPLMGLPVALKDHISVAGMPTRAGSALDLNDVIAPEGPLVDRLRRAGCVIPGKTRATEFALGAFNLRHPTPRNPWDATVARMPGGSSNGSAVATAAGFCAFAFGSDTGGSVRQPAALCGLVGFKPSSGVFPLGGVFPLSPELDTLGTFTRSVRDAIVIYEALGGAPVQQRTSVRGLRLAKPVGRFSRISTPMSRARSSALSRPLRRPALSWRKFRFQSTSIQSTRFSRRSCPSISSRRSGPNGSARRRTSSIRSRANACKLPST